VAKRSEKNALVCPLCRKPVKGAAELRASVRIASGLAHSACHQAMKAAVEETIADALTAGTHTTDPPVHACRGCGEWRPIWYRSLDGQDLCYACTPESKK